jgi:hypothetical protein
LEIPVKVGQIWKHWAGELTNHGKHWMKNRDFYRRSGSARKHRLKGEYNLSMVAAQKFILPAKITALPIESAVF